MANYVTRATLKEALRIPVDENEADALLDQAIAAASSAIDEHCGRRFDKDSSATARTFRPDAASVWESDGHLLLVDDIAETTGLVVETGSVLGGWTAVTGYDTAPDNALVKGRPITGLRRLNGWPSGVTGTKVRVTAKWGWPSVPNQVAQAALIQSQRLYRRKDTPEGVTGSAEYGVIRLTRVDPDIEQMLSHFVIPGFG